MRAYIRIMKYFIVVIQILYIMASIQILISYFTIVIYIGFSKLKVCFKIKK